MPQITTGLAVSIAMTAAFCTGCGPGPATPASSSPDPGAAVTTSTAKAAQGPAAGPVIPVTIASGAVTPTNAEADAVVGQPIVLEVNSDAADGIHVHSIPENVFEVKPQSGQRFEFTVQVPGSVAVELHELHRTIVTIAVRPR